MICNVNINYRFDLFEFVLAIKLFGFMVYHYGINPVTSWHNITSRNAIENKKFYISKYTVDWNTYSLNYSRTPEMYTCPIPNPPSWHCLGCSYSCLRLPARWASVFLATASNASSGFSQVYMWLCNILWSLIVPESSFSPPCQVGTPRRGREFVK